MKLLFAYDSFSRIVILTIGALLLPFAAIAEEPGKVDSMQVFELGGQNSKSAVLHVQYEAINADSRSGIEFVAEMFSTNDLGRVEFELYTQHRDGTELGRQTAKLTDIDEHARTLFSWDANLYPDGDYRLFLEVYNRAGRRIAWRSYAVRLLSKETFEASMSDARTTLDGLETYLLEHADTLPDSNYIQLRSTIVREAMKRAEERRETDWNTAYALSQLVIENGNSLRAQATFGARRPTPFGEVPLDSPVSVGREVRAHHGARPAYLFGLTLDAERELSENLMKALGMTSAYRSDGNAEGKGTWYSLDGSSERVLMRNAVTHPDALVPDPELRMAFRNYIREIYPSHRDVNRVWRTRLFSFDEVDIWLDKTSPAYQWDLQSFLRQQATQNIADVLAVNQSESNIPMAVSFSETLLEQGNTRSGIYPDDLTEAVDGWGLELSGSLDDEKFGIAIHRRAMLIALLSSVAPEVPLLVRDDPIISIGGVFERDERQDMYTLVWESIMWGADGLTLGGWTDREDPSHYLFYPEALEGYALAAADIQRLAPLVRAFQDSPAQIGILWSGSARTYEDGVPFLSSVRAAFEGVSSSGHSIRFVTEAQAARGGLDGIELLVLADMPTLSDAAFAAVQQYAEAGGAVVRSPSVFPFDETGQLRNDTIVFSREIYSVRSGQYGMDYLDGIDDLRSAPTVSPVPRAVNSFGFPLEGVHSRYLMHEDKEYFYFVNLRKDTVTCNIEGVERAGATDLISGQRVELPFLAKPLRPVLLELDPPAAPEPTEVDSDTVPITPDLEELDAD